jgi:pimeloyl-ACP methyl ester carboxylesterase
MHQIIIAVFGCFLGFFSHLFAVEGRIAQVNGIEIWYETFGNFQDPAMLLIMGTGGQGILWPQKLCNQIADEGFYVIRFDNRDTGQSTSISYRNTPYDLNDMALDAIGLLDHLQIAKGHVVGASMGGAIAQLMAAHFPERICSITLLGSSYDFVPLMNAFTGASFGYSPLSGPKDGYVKWMHSVVKNPKPSKEEKFQLILKGWEISNGRGVPFENQIFEDLVYQALEREDNPEGVFNHVLALNASLYHMKEVQHLIQAPALVIHGSEDPIVPIDHGQALAEAIRGAKLLEVKGMGHFVHSSFYDLIIEAIKSHVRSV